MPRLIRISLKKRNVSCVARLLDQEAPRTCSALWDALPQSGPVYHAKYARNEIYILVPRFAQPEPGRENPTITPIPGDLVYFGFVPGNVYGAITEGLAEFAAASRDIWRAGGKDEILGYERMA